MFIQLKKHVLPLAFSALASLILAAPANSQTASQTTAPKTVGIANLGQHPAISIVIDAFKTEMQRLGWVEGKTVAYEYADASFTQSLMPQMLAQITAKRPAAILTLTTSVSQAALSSVSDKSIPMVFALVTEPVRAGLVPAWDRGSDRFTGQSDLQAFEAVLEFGKKLLPHAKSFGVLYNPGEVNDVTTTAYLQEAADKVGLIFKPVSLEAVGDVPQRMPVLRDADFLYVTGSNTVLPAMPAVSASARRMKLPIISSETSYVQQGLADANYAVNLDSNGINAARQMDKVLRGESPRNLPVLLPEHPRDYVITIHRGQLKAMGFAVPATLADCDCFLD